MAGRPPGSKNPPNSKLRMGAEYRAKIQNSTILNRLIGHVDGSVELTPSQVTAGLGLLKKVMPDLASHAHSGDDEAEAIKLAISWQPSSK